MKQDYNKNLKIQPKIQPMNRKVYATTIYVFLTRSGNTKTVWIDMGWTGNMRVNAIKFNSFSFTNGSSLNLVTYKKYNATTKNANTQTTGSFTLGSMLVPTGTNRVKGKTSGLKD